MARARERARPNLGLPRSRLAPDCSKSALGRRGGLGPIRPQKNITSADAQGEAVPVREGLSRATTAYYDHPPSPCRPDRPREAAALWAREWAPVARGSAANICRGGVGLRGAGPAVWGAPGRCVLLSTSCDPSKIARSNLRRLKQRLNQLSYGCLCNRASVAKRT